MGHDHPLVAELKLMSINCGSGVLKMIWSPLSRFTVKFLFWSMAGLSFTSIALGQMDNIEPQVSPVQLEGQDASVIEQNAISQGLESVGQAANNALNEIVGSGLPPKFTADGQPIDLRNVGLSITPPQGWDVITSDPTLTLIMQEPESKEVIYDKPLYRRNITVAKVAEPSPIDQQRAEQLKVELSETFGKQGGVDNFQIVEHKFFDYKGKNDALLVYTSFTMGQNALMQMHVLISNSERQFLMTYTDFAERFQDEQLFNQAWATIAGAIISGEPPSRWLNLIIALSSAIVLIFGLFLLVFFRHRRATRMYMHDADEVYRDDAPSTRISSDSSWIDDACKDSDLAVTQTGIWNLASSGSDDDDDWGFDTANDSQFKKSAKSGAWNNHRKEGNSDGGLSFVTSFS